MTLMAWINIGFQELLIFIIIIQVYKIKCKLEFLLKRRLTKELKCDIIDGSRAIKASRFTVYMSSVNFFVKKV